MGLRRIHFAYDVLLLLNPKESTAITSNNRRKRQNGENGFTEVH
jgi:hypothetical protein